MNLIKFSNLFFIVFSITISVDAQIGHIQKSATLKIKGEPVEGVKYYLLNGTNLFSIQYQDGVISFPDTLSSKLIDLVVSYNKHNFFVTNFNYKESHYLDTYFDNRIFNNEVNKKFGGYNKFKYLCKKRYLIDDGSGYVTITRWFNIKKFNIATNKE